MAYFALAFSLLSSMVVADHDKNLASFVRALHHDLYRRPAFDTEVSSGIQDMQSLGSQTVVRRYVKSKENWEREIETYYERFLDRQPSQSELQGWLGLIQRKNLRWQDVQIEFLASDELYRHCGSIEVYVHTLYEVALSREGDKAGVDFWINRLKAGTSRRDVAKGFVSSDEYLGNTISKWHRWFLRRVMDVRDYQHWLSKMKSEPGEDVLIQILTGSEYFEVIKNIF